MLIRLIVSIILCYFNYLVPISVNDCFFSRSPTTTDTNEPTLGIRVSLTRDPDLGLLTPAETHGLLDKSRDVERSVFESQSDGAILEIENHAVSLRSFEKFIFLFSKYFCSIELK